MSVAANSVVLGLQWGDEGKGKVIDQLSDAVDIVVRCQGGANAGHTVVVNGDKTVLHLLPSGALHESAVCVIGNGVVVDPLALSHELDDLRSKGLDLAPRLRVSDRAHLVLPVHKAIDAATETAKGAGKVGTTLRGIGPTYGDKVARLGVRCGDLRDAAGFRRRVLELVAAANRALASLGAAAVDAEKMLADIAPCCERLRPLVSDTVEWLHERSAAGDRILFEGAQGALLDIDFGTYPYVTSSNTGTGGILTGSGLSHRQLGRIIGIVKAYSTRVGGGPFPTELDNPVGEALRQRGGEYGATTGRPRRCGWLDLVVVGQAARINGVDEIALTKLDVLSGERELPVCVAYRLPDGSLTTAVPARVEDLAVVQPVYETLPGWSGTIAGCNRFTDLPVEARRYIDFIAERTRLPVRIIGTGPDRAHTIVR
jgi:adenylosuccinate synthase